MNKVMKYNDNNNANKNKNKIDVPFDFEIVDNHTKKTTRKKSPEIVIIPNYFLSANGNDNSQGKYAQRNLKIKKFEKVDRTYSRSDSSDLEKRRSIQIREKNGFASLSDDSLNDVPDNLTFDTCELEELQDKIQLVINNFDISFEGNSQIQHKYKFHLDYCKFSFYNVQQFYIKKKTKDRDEITIQTCDNRTIKFNILKQYELKLRELFRKFSFPENLRLFSRYARYYYKQYTSNNKEYIKPKTFDEWRCYNIKNEFLRQNVNWKTIKLIKNNNLCETYPEEFCVPIIMKDEEIKLAAEYRIRHRLPVLTYYYSNNSKLKYPTSIWRSSQASVGILGQKSEEDVKLLTYIAGEYKKIKIFDARGEMVAMANRLKGGGAEIVRFYTDVQMEMIHCNIENIHEVRKTLISLISQVIDPPKEIEQPFKYISDSTWYDIIISIIKSSIKICDSLKEGWNILIHCSDGWDRTTQLCAISQIFIDPYYRTLEGFIVLIEKDWLSFGHQIAMRCGLNLENNINSSSQNEYSPIFLQWLDCMFQLLTQNPYSFEFNSELLLFLAEEVYNGKYGTFLFNKEKDRKIFKLHENTISIWNDVLNSKNKFLNPFYKDNTNQTLTFDVRLIKFWDEYFLRFVKEFQNSRSFKHELMDNLISLQEEIKKLKVQKEWIIDN